MKYRRENIWGFAFIVLAGGVLLCFATYTIHTRYVEAALKAPFNISDIRESAGIEDTEKFSCERPSTPMNDLKLEAFKDSIPENKTSATRFENQVTLMANRYVQSNPARTDVSDCVVEWLVSWAKQDALLSYADNTGQQIRTSVLASAALAYLQIRNEKTFKEEDAKVIRQWLHDLSTNVIKDFSENTDLITSHNNHLYWMIWSVAVTAIALDDPRLFYWATDQAKIGIAQISAEGALPREMAQGSKALINHINSAFPLYLLAEAGLANDINLYAENEGGLHQLARLIMNNADDPSFFDQVTGEKQDMELAVTSSNMGWIELYNKHYPSAQTQQWIDRLGPFQHLTAGGNTTLLYNY